MKYVLGIQKHIVVMSTGCCKGVWYHYVEYLKLTLHCTLTSRNLNKTFFKRFKKKLIKLAVLIETEALDGI